MELTNKDRIKYKDLSAKQVAGITAGSIGYIIWRATMIIASVIFFVWFLAPMSIGIVCVGNILGCLICAFVFCFYVLRYFFVLAKYAFYKKKVTRIIWKTAKCLIYAFICYCVIISGVIIYYANIPPEENATAVVLGAQVKGTQPSAILYDRIKSAENYLNKNKDAMCVVSGGQGSDEEISEAQCMYNVMTQDGISPQRILIEDKSTNTKENIEFSNKIITQNNKNTSLAIVTDGFHQARARLVAIKQGVTAPIGAVSVKTNIVFLPTFVVREWVALPFEVLFR